MIQIQQRVVRVPSGPCPIKLAAFWEFTSQGCVPPAPAICSWFWEIRDYGLRRGEFLTAEAIAYYARYEFPPPSDDYEEIERVIYEYAVGIGDEHLPTSSQTELAEKKNPT